jgi:phosphate acetyltransferase
MPHTGERPHHEDFVARCRGLPPLVTAVVHPCDRLALEGAVACAKAGLIVPLLVGNEEKIRAVARGASLSLDGYEIVTAPHSHAAAATAAELARAGRVEALMKGSLHSDELLHEVTKPDSGLHTQRRISHAWVMDVPAYPEPLIVTDAVVNVSPTLAQKRDIVQNAVDLARALDVREVRVAVLSAIETVNADIATTVEAAALSKMADRGQITGAIVDGPMALDDAIDAAAATEKGLFSPVAGRANVLVVPNFEAGNMLAKGLIQLSGGAAAGIVVGARVPILLTRRAGGIAARLASAAVAVLAVRHAVA